MYCKFLISLLFFLPLSAFAETPEKEATRICSEYIRIKKDCYYKALKGVLPIKGMKGIKSKLPEETIESFCKDGYDAYGEAGKLKPEIVNQSMQFNFTQCYNGYINKANCAELRSSVSNAAIAMEASFLDYSKYPSQIPFKENSLPIPSSHIKIFLIDNNDQEYTIKASSEKCDKEYSKIYSDGNITESIK